MRTPQERPTAPTLKEYATGVRIDWRDLVVEVDAVVTLRQGPLELLACSPQTREHESILVIRARPLRIHEAMGLIGLTPGAPVRYDDQRDRWLPASGESLSLDIRYRDSGVERTVAARRWLLDVQRHEPPEQLDWIFAGSRRGRDGRFGADAAGTVVAVVDFDTALIAPAALHSSSNEALWLEANTAAIPPVGTPCTLLIRSTRDRIPGGEAEPVGPTDSRRD